MSEYAAAPTFFETVDATPLIVWLPLAILKVIFPVPLPEVFVALTTNTELPVVVFVGVPLITPDVAFKLSPVGNVPLATA